jgi:hypothetical protein
MKEAFWDLFSKQQKCAPEFKGALEVMLVTKVDIKAVLKG